MSLKDLKISPVYDSSSCSLVDSFLVPVLKNSIYYDRRVGYFSSGWLREASAGMKCFVENGGRARWIISSILYEDDWNVIVREEDLRSDDYLKNLLMEQTPPGW
jgi:hypothetical protein